MFILKYVSFLLVRSKKQIEEGENPDSFVITYCRVPFKVCVGTNFISHVYMKNSRQFPSKGM